MAVFLLVVLLGGGNRRKEWGGGWRHGGCDSLVARVVAILDVGSAGDTACLTTHFYIQTTRYKKLTTCLSALIIILSNVIITPPDAPTVNRHGDNE